MLAPWDVWKYRNETVAGAVANARKFSLFPLYEKLHAFAELIRGFRENSRAILMLRHLIYDRDTLVRLYLRNGDESDYLRTPFTDAWRARLEFVDTLIERLSLKTGKSGVPVVVAFVPFAPSAILAGSKDQQPGLDPFAFDRAIGAMSAEHGAQFIDVLDPMSRLPRPVDMYYLVNGHPNAAGNAIIADAVESEILKNPRFASCGLPPGVEGADAR